jgi:alcohol dehydrogenase
MKALQIRQFGGREVLELNQNAAQPSPGPEQVLVEVHAASLNPVDWKIRAGYLQEIAPLTLPATLGGDFAGVVKSTGEPASNLKIDDRVFGYGSVLAGGTGSFAECVAADISKVAHAPTNASFVECAALPLVGASAIEALEEHIKLQPGQNILIHGGAGGIGSVAIQLAKFIGAHVVATARADDTAYVQEIGADEVIDYQKEAFETKLRNIDAVFDTVGGETLDKSLNVLKKGGVLVSMVGSPNLDTARNAGVTVISQFTQVTSEVLQRLAQLVDNGIINIYVHKSFVFEQYPHAFELLEASHSRGKLVLDIKKD